MPKLTRNAVKCLRCGDLVESRHRHDFRWCSCQNIAVDGGLEYVRLLGAALMDASWEPLYEYADGSSATGSQFAGFLSGAIPWSGGDGRALERLITALKSGVSPDPQRLKGTARARLGYLAEVALSADPAPEATAILRDIIEQLRWLASLGEGDRQHATADDVRWLPDQAAGEDLRSGSWGLSIGLSERFRHSLGAM